MTKETKFRTDGFKMRQDFISKGYSDAMIFKERGGLTVIIVVDGRIKYQKYYGYHFKNFKSQEDVNTFIDKFISDNK